MRYYVHRAMRMVKTGSRLGDIFLGATKNINHSCEPMKSSADRNTIVCARQTIISNPIEYFEMHRFYCSKKSTDFRLQYSEKVK